MTACEYVQDENGNYYYGITSEPVSYRLNGIPESEEEEEQEQGSEEEPHELSEYERWLNGMAYGYPLEMRCYGYVDRFDDYAGSASREILRNLIGQTMTIGSDGSFRFSAPTGSADYAYESKVSEKGNQTKYYGSRTLSFSFSGRMVPNYELHPDHYPSGWDPSRIDWGYPVVDSASLITSSESHEQGTFNSSNSPFTKDSSGTLTADEFTEKYYLGATLTYGGTIKSDHPELTFVEEDRMYLVMCIDLAYEGRYVGTHDEWWDKSGTMDEHRSHSDYDHKSEYVIGLRFISEKPVSEYIRSYYE